MVYIQKRPCKLETAFSSPSSIDDGRVKNYILSCNPSSNTTPCHTIGTQPKRSSRVIPESRKPEATASAGWLVSETTENGGKGDDDFFLLFDYTEAGDLDLYGGCKL